MRLIVSKSAKYGRNGKATQQLVSASTWKETNSLRGFMAVVGHCVLGKDLGLQQVDPAVTKSVKIYLFSVL